MPHSSCGTEYIERGCITFTAVSDRLSFTIALFAFPCMQISQTTTGVWSTTLRRAVVGGTTCPTPRNCLHMSASEARSAGMAVVTD